MGYFSNGTEGESYQEQFCNHCLNDRNEDCPIWGLQLSYNYNCAYWDILDQFIPKTKDGRNGQCKMFISTKKKNPQELPE